jgi:DNA repair protein RadD
MELREYQKQSIEKILWSMRSQLDGNDLVVLPTGSGKSIVISYLANELNEPILILQPTKEILEQNLEKLSKYVDKNEIGIYSASMNEKNIGKYTFATIGSVYKKPELFSHFSLMIIDEAHLVNPRSLDGMFSSFIKRIDVLRTRQNKTKVKIIGFTATPYRMDTKYVPLDNYWHSFKVSSTIKLINRTKGFFWKRILYNINIQDLINMGYLCPLEYIDKSIVKQSDIPLNKSESDFDLDRYEEMLTDKQQEILQSIALGMSLSNSVLVFCSSVSQANKLQSMIKNSAVVSAKTSKKERDKIIEDFRSGKIKIMFNVGVLTVGFDFPSLGCIILLRPTRSIGLYLQMVGRGLRIAENKKVCYVIDMTNTVSNIGRVETIKLLSGRESQSGKWELVSEIKNDWHNCELYNFTIKR